MKIAILTNNQKPLPSSRESMYSPNLVASDITEELVKRDHEVFLFSGKDSKTSAHLYHDNIYTCYHDYPKMAEENLAEYQRLSVQYELYLVSKAIEMANRNKFDIIHAHDQNLLPYFSNLIEKPILFTYHANIDFDIQTEINKKRFQRFYKNNYYVSISDWQKNKSWKYLNIVSVVKHGIDLKKYDFSSKTEDHILFLARMVENKGPDLAIKVALRLNKKIVLGGDIGKNEDNQSFFDEKIKPQIDNNKVQFLGHVPFDKTAEQYQKAKLFILPNRWEEPFGLVMIEAMACGTPVVAFDRGAVREIIKDGETGFICPPDNVKCMMNIVKKIYEMPEKEYRRMRIACRKHIEENFTVTKMVDGYEKVYQKVIEDWKRKKI